MTGQHTKGPLSRRERDRERGGKGTALQNTARLLRKRASNAEQLLWHHLRGRRLAGYKFRRQVVIEPCIADFLCYEAMLIIEADGGQHPEQKRYDARRSARLGAMGYRVIRFWNDEILTETQAVLEQICRVLLNEPPSPRLSPRGRGGGV